MFTTARPRLVSLFALLVAGCSAPDSSSESTAGLVAQGVGVPAPGPEVRTRVVVLGTGTPNADPERSGPSVAVIVDDRAFLFDAGPGVVRRAAQAARDLDLTALEATGLTHVFVTHLHSDHTLGLPDLLLTPWVLDRLEPLSVVGPPGIEAMMDAIVTGWSADIDMRVNGLEPRDLNRDTYRPVVSTTRGGVVYDEDDVRIEAIPVAHGDWDHSLAYRIEGPDRTIVISGDAVPSESIVEACNGCDLLVHEVYSGERLSTRPPEWQTYHRAFHTSPEQLVDIATRARPTALVLYHQLYWGTDDAGLIQEMRSAGWNGPLVSARDLGVY